MQVLRTGKRALALAGLGWIVLAAGCASAPRVPMPLMVHVRITASDDINPDTTGRASPVVVRMFQLHDAGNFGNADFFAIYDHEKETLAADLLGSAEYVLRPGESRDLDLQPDPNVQNLAVMGAFRDLASSQWRASWHLPPPPKKPRKAPLQVQVTIMHNAIAIAAAAPPVKGH
jgi:type VI secretion system protein VasD